MLRQPIFRLSARNLINLHVLPVPIPPWPPTGSTYLYITRLLHQLRSTHPLIRYIIIKKYFLWWPRSKLLFSIFSASRSLPIQIGTNRQTILSQLDPPKLHFHWEIVLLCQEIQGIWYRIWFDLRSWFYALPKRLSGASAFPLFSSSFLKWPDLGRHISKSTIS